MEEGKRGGGGGEGRAGGGERGGRGQGVCLKLVSYCPKQWKPGELRWGGGQGAKGGDARSTVLSIVGPRQKGGGAALCGEPLVARVLLRVKLFYCLEKRKRCGGGERRGCQGSQ